MPYSREMAERLRHLLKKKKGITEKTMFGGLAFFLHDHLLVGAMHNDLIARIGPEMSETALQWDFVLQFQPTGRPMRGWVIVEAPGLELDENLKFWLDRSIDFVKDLPPKPR